MLTLANHGNPLLLRSGLLTDIPWGLGRRFPLGINPGGGQFSVITSGPSSVVTTNMPRCLRFKQRLTSTSFCICSSEVSGHRTGILLSGSMENTDGLAFRADHLVVDKATRLLILWINHPITQHNHLFIQTKTHKFQTRI